MIGSGGGRWDAPLKSTVRAQNTIKLNCAMNDSFFLFIFFIADFFWCLRRSGFVVGARENGLGAHPNFLYAGKTLEARSICLCDFSFLLHSGMSFAVASAEFMKPHLQTSSRHCSKCMSIVAW